MTIEVAHVEYYNKSLKRMETLRVTSSEDYVANGAAYYPCIAESFDYSQTLFGRGTVSGEVSVGVGTLVLNNADGKLDKYRWQGFDGRRISIYRPENKHDARTNDETILFTGTISYVEFSWDKVTFYVKSRLEEINVPIQPSVYSGTNLGTGAAGGIEGSESLKDKTKPRIFGRCHTVEGVLANEFFLLYAFNYDGEGNPAPVHRFYNVYVRGIRYVHIRDYSTVTELMNVNLSLYGPGFYATCVSAGMLRLSSTAAGGGAVVADVSDAEEPFCNVTDTVQRILENVAGLRGGEDYDSGMLQTLKQVNPAPVGIAISGSETIAGVIMQLLDSIGAWMAPGTNGVFRFGIIEQPPILRARGALPRCVISRYQWDDAIESVPVADESKNIPARSVEVLYARNWRVQDSNSLADSVDALRRSIFKEEYMSALAEDAVILEAHPLAPTLEYKTLLAGQLEAQLRNGFFTVAVFSPNNGWELEGANPNSQSDGYVRFGTGTSVPDYSKISQTLRINEHIVAGELELLFSVPEGSSIYLMITRTASSSTETVLSEAYDLQGEYTVRFDTGENAEEITLSFISDGTYSKAVGRVRLNHVSKGLTPWEEADRRLKVQSGQQERYLFTIPLSFYKQYSIELGSLVTLRDESRFGLQEGKDFIVIGVDPTTSDYKVSLDVWRSEKEEDDN